MRMLSGFRSLEGYQEGETGAVSPDDEPVDDPLPVEVFQATGEFCHPKPDDFFWYVFSAFQMDC